MPSTTGFDRVSANFPAIVQNTGWEFSANIDVIRTKAITWASSINLTIPRNKLIEFPNLATSSYRGSLKIGEPLGITKVFHFDGVNDSLGVYEFFDEKGAKTYDPVSGQDETIWINTGAKLFGGFSNTISI